MKKLNDICYKTAQIQFVNTVITRISRRLIVVKLNVSPIFGE